MKEKKTNRKGRTKKMDLRGGHRGGGRPWVGAEGKRKMGEGRPLKEKEEEGGVGRGRKKGEGQKKGRRRGKRQN